jgi:uncharacterized protein DUF4115
VVVLVDGVIVAVVIVSLVGALLLRRRSRDDDHSVEGYHRQIHTLETMSEHPAGSAGVAGAARSSGASGSSGALGLSGSTGKVAGPVTKHAYPESAVRLTDSTTVRPVEGPPDTVPPPVVPPSIPTPAGRGPAPGVAFDDTGARTGTKTGAKAGAKAGEVEPGPTWHEDPAIGTMNHRPRQLAAPAAAVAAVLVLVVILVALGSHGTPPKHHHTVSSGHRKTDPGGTSTDRTTTTSAALPIVSAPIVTTASEVSYEVSKSQFTLVLSATTGECWVSVTGPTGTNIFTGLMATGERQTVSATGLVSVEVGAPLSFAATVNGTKVALPATYQSPLTLHFTPAASAPA